MQNLARCRRDVTEKTLVDLQLLSDILQSSYALHCQKFYFEELSRFHSRVRPRHQTDEKAYACNVAVRFLVSTRFGEGL
jgi:hypothetical protein